MAQRERRFPLPDELEYPAESEGWEDLYPDTVTFGLEGKDEFERDLFWFQNGTQGPYPFYPWETIWPEYWQISLSQYNSRVFAIPPALGVEFRLVNGYLYCSPLGVEDEEKIQEREEIFRERSQHHFQNFDELYENEWKPKVREAGEAIRNLAVPEELPEYSPEEVVTESRGKTVAAEVLQNYHALQDHALDAWQYHFEFLNLAYTAYLTFYDFCQENFPGLREETIGKMVAAIEETEMFRPEEELNRLARLAVDLGGDVPEILRSDAGPDETVARLEESPEGREWLQAFEEAKEPWFRLSHGTGYFHHEGFWVDTLEAPFEHLQSKVRRLQNDETIERPFGEIEEERRELVEEYRGYLETEEQRQAFDETYGMCRTIYSYAEDHNFWIDNWVNSLVYEKMREFGDLLVAQGLLEERDDIFLFDRFEVAELLEEMAATWAIGAARPTSDEWKTRAARRQRILDAAEEWSPPPALGVPPEEVTEPFTIMLWGVTTEKVEGWLSDGEMGEQTELEGFPSSPGSVQGRARVIKSPKEIEDVLDDEILVAPATNPSWAPVFPRIEGAVTDSGGTASHAAIVCREYGLPAVTGTGIATQAIETGDVLRIDGNEGEVEIVEKAVSGGDGA